MIERDELIGDMIEECINRAKVNGRRPVAIWFSPEALQRTFDHMGKYGMTEKQEQVVLHGTTKGLEWGGLPCFDAPLAGVSVAVTTAPWVHHVPVQ